MNALETAARNFIVSPKAGRQLERHRATVLMLRAKEATFSQIQDLLAQHGLLVSESSITRFCRKHRAEIQRLRLQREQEFDLPIDIRSRHAADRAAIDPQQENARSQSSRLGLRHRPFGSASLPNRPPAVAFMGRFGFEALGFFRGAVFKLRCELDNVP